MRHAATPKPRAPTRRKAPPPAATCFRLLHHEGAHGPPRDSTEDALLALYGACRAPIPRRRP